MAYVTTISMNESDRKFIKENNISLSRLVREKIAETRSASNSERVSQSSHSGETI